MRKTLLSSALLAMLASVPFVAQAAATETLSKIIPSPGGIVLAMSETMATPANTPSMPMKEGVVKDGMAMKDGMAANSGMVNLNTADAATLQKELAGIGAAKAKAIVAFREQNGAFTSVEELLEVDGIGKALLDRNRDRLAVN